MADPTLTATHFIDADSPAIRDYAAQHAGHGDARARAVQLYYAVRDKVRYDIAAFGLDRDAMVASHVLTAASAFCVPKAILLAAVARASGIPARLGFANVRNHLTSPRYAALMDGDLFEWHAYTALQLDGRWVKATPAFDIDLCQRHGVKPLEFDGTVDSVFHEFDTNGRRHMEYVKFIGEFDDLPYDTFALEMNRAYPRLLAALDQDRIARRSGQTH
ncbi:MAG: transglutaminase-like domain-containing protein [Gemmobacter sp.]|nr:transglutaminase-like domain-containing protein [Gemmobacter sp.]